MPRERFDVEVPDGTHFGVSRDTDGAFRAHLFDDETNGLVGHAELFEPVEDEAESLTDSPSVFVYVTDDRASDAQAQERSELLGNLMVLVVLFGVAKAKPHVEGWWNDQALPAMRSTWNGRARSRFRRTGRRANTAEVSTLVGSAPAESPQEVMAALEAHIASMSSEEARGRFLAAVTARVFSDEQLRMLRDARIEDDDGPSELESALETPAAQQIAERMALMLEADPPLLDEATLAELGKILGGGRLDAYCVPVSRQRIVEAPRRSDPE